MTVALLVLSLGQTSQMEVPGSLVAEQIQAATHGAEMVLDHGGSFIKLTGLFGPKRFDFDLPERTVDLGYLGSIKYRIKDMRLSEIKVKAEKEEFVTTATFESKGVEFKGTHSSLGDAGAPDVELDDPVLEVRLRPVITSVGRVSYANPKVKFSARVDNTAIPRFTVFGHEVDVVNLCSNYRTQLCKSIAVNVRRFLDDPARRAAFSNLVQEAIGKKLNGTGIAYSGFRFKGTDLIVSLK